jgi:hypothetical protein
MTLLSFRNWEAEWKESWKKKEIVPVILLF